MLSLRPMKRGSSVVDSILRGYDVPKFYLRQVGKKPEKFDVVDGQQRTRAIWEFLEGK